jgi:tripartite-type tricarboxylate transporter receptor subunit TctC
MATPGQAVMNQFMYARMPYDTATAFTPIAFVASVPSVLVVSPSLNVATLAEFLAAMKARPDGSNFGSAVRWPRLFGQNFRCDKWRLCRG